MSRLGQIPNLPPSTTRSDCDVESSASSGQKRRRDGSPTQSTSFLQAAKTLVSQRSNVNRCWNCEAPHTEFCHVIAKADPAYTAMVKKGMITFGALGDYRNAIVLCGSCHNHYDRTSNTGWVFLPARMGWIIQWEEDDYKSRQETLERTGRIVERSYPNEEDYERYMRETGLITDPDDGLVRGGLYHSYILEDMFPPLMIEALKQRGMETPGVMPGGPKRWHGAPMAAVNRGFVVTGAPEMKLPEKEWEQLRTLQRLYSRKLTGAKNQDTLSNKGTQESTQILQDESFLEESGLHTKPPAAPQISVGTGRKQSGKDRNPLEEDFQADSFVETRSGKGRREKRRYANSAEIDRFKRTRWDVDPDGLGVEEESWCFGPGSTSEQKVKMHLGNFTTV